MPRRRRRRVAPALAATALAALAGVAGCQTDSGTGGCQLTQQVILPGDALTLLHDARLDRVGDRYVLLGADRAKLRWAGLDAAAGQLGPAQEFALRADAPVGPWFALAGAHAPADTVLVAQGLPGQAGGDLVLRITALPAAGGPAGPQGPALPPLPGAALPAAHPLIAMATSRLGLAAALAWVDTGTNSVNLAAVDGSGAVVGAPVALDTAPAFACLVFTPGKAELTLGYYKYVDGPGTAPSWVIAELHENGAVDSTLTMTLDNKDAGCPLVVPTDNGYALAWQDSVGSWLGVYDGRTNRLQTYPFASALAFHGADLQPPLAGLAPVGKDFAVLFAEARSAELWRLDVVGSRRPGTLGFPSLQGDMGSISSFPAAGSLYATYADYTATDGGVGTSGQRYFVKASCF